MIETLLAGWALGMALTGWLGWRMGYVRGRLDTLNQLVELSKLPEDERERQLDRLTPERWKEAR